MSNRFASTRSASARRVSRSAAARSSLTRNLRISLDVAASLPDRSPETGRRRLISPGRSSDRGVGCLNAWAKLPAGFCRGADRRWRARAVGCRHGDPTARAGSRIGAPRVRPDFSWRGPDPAAPLACSERPQSANRSPSWKPHIRYNEGSARLACIVPGASWVKAPFRTISILKLRIYDHSLERKDQPDHRQCPPGLAARSWPLICFGGALS